MTTENNTIRLNPNKASTLEFEVMVSGLENITPIVKFVIQNAKDNIDWVVKCKKLEGSKWEASFPAFKNFKLDKCNFCVEVIVDEYWFCPADGIIEFITAPDVSFKSKTGSNKPSVTTSFTVKQLDEPIKSKEKKKKVTEASGGGEITGQYAPTNDLLIPEKEPIKSKAKIPRTEKDDELVNKARLDQITDEEPTPGTGTPYPQDTEKEEIEDEIIDNIRNRIAPKGEFNSKKVAEDILQHTIGKPKSPILKGTLFKRDSDGKAIIPGLETNKQLQEKADKEQRVKDILGTK